MAVAPLQAGCPRIYRDAMSSLPDSGVTAVAADGLLTAPATPGLVRELAFDTDRAMLVRVRCDGGVSSGWHHHGDREVLGHVMRGRVRFEFGPGGRESIDVEEGG